MYKTHIGCYNFNKKVIKTTCLAFSLFVTNLAIITLNIITSYTVGVSIKQKSNVNNMQCAKNVGCHIISQEVIMVTCVVFDNLIGNTMNISTSYNNMVGASI